MTSSSNIRRYDPAECAVFRRTRERWGALSNFAPARIEVNGLKTYHAEGLYQATRFPHRADIQKIVCAQRNPMNAKRTAHGSVQHTRRDWQNVNIDLMRWVLRVRLVQNPETLAPALEGSGEMPIVEHSLRDHFWGAGYEDDGRLVGVNALGRLLMELRAELGADHEKTLSAAMPPNVSNPFMNGLRIPTIRTEGARETAEEPAASPNGRVVNIKDTKKYDVFIGRPSRLGNPYRIGPSISRAQAIARFETWLRDQITAGQFTLGFVASLRGKTLGCYCAPQPCHGHVWLYYANWASTLSHGRIRSRPELPERMTQAA